MTGEVLSSGPDPDRPPVRVRVPRWLRLAVLALVPLVAVGLLVRGVGSRGTARAPSAAPPSAGPSAADRPVPDPPAALPHLAGPPGTAPAGLAMLVSGRSAGVFNPVTGLVTPLAGLPSRPGTDVTVVRSGDTVAAEVSGGDSSALYVHTAGAAGYRAVGNPAWVLPAPGDGMYVVSHTDPQMIEERDSRWGLRWRRPLPPREIPLLGTRHGLVIGLDPGPAGVSALTLVSPRSGHVLRRLGKVASFAVAGDGDRLGYVPVPCGARCSLRILDLRTGRARSYPLPGHGPFGGSSFSPDGRTLALAWYGEHDELAPGPTQLLGFVATVDLATGRWQRVPGVDTPAKEAADLGWAADGRLVLGIRFPALLRFALWRPGDPQVSVLPRAVQTAADGWVSAAVLS